MQVYADWPNACEIHGYLAFLKKACKHIYSTDMETVVWVVGGCFGMKARMDETHLSVFHSVSNRSCRKRLRNFSSAAWYTHFFCLMQESVRRSRYMIWPTFYVERVRVHRIKIIDHSCFHNHWPTSKTKLKWKHIWEQGGPLVFQGPTQLAYSVYSGGSALWPDRTSFN